MGLSELLGVGDGELDNLCYSYVDESCGLKAGILGILNTYDRSELDEEQLISFDSYSWLLEDWAEEHQFMYHFYPITPRYSRQIDLIRLFTNEHQLETRQNAEDYVSRLNQVDDQIACLIENLDDSEDRGIVAPSDLLWHAADELRFIAPGSATELPFYTAYVEGWALYAEHLAGELGWYFDVYCELGRLQAELMRAARLVLDTGIHYRRWSHEYALNYYQRVVGAGPNEAWGQVELYTFFPGYFSSYKIGMHKILELRQRAMDQLGGIFDLRAFHRAVLTHNRLPLPLLERIIDDFIAAEIERHTPRRIRGRRVASP